MLSQIQPSDDFIALKKLDAAGINISENIKLCEVILRCKPLDKAVESITHLHQKGVLDSFFKVIIQKTIYS